MLFLRFVDENYIINVIKLLRWERACNKTVIVWIWKYMFWCVVNIARRQDFVPELVHIFPYPTNNL